MNFLSLLSGGKIIGAVLGVLLVLVGVYHYITIQAFESQVLELKTTVNNQTETIGNQKTEISLLEVSSKQMEAVISSQNSKIDALEIKEKENLKKFNTELVKIKEKYTKEREKVKNLKTPLEICEAMSKSINEAIK